MSDTQQVTLTGEFPATMSERVAELSLALATIDKRLDGMDLREFRHHPRVRADLQRARNAVDVAVKALASIKTDDPEESS